MGKTDKRERSSLEDVKAGEKETHEKREKEGRFRGMGRFGRIREAGEEEGEEEGEGEGEGEET